MYLATLDCATSNPSLSSSPWMRGAPHSGLRADLAPALKVAADLRNEFAHRLDTKLGEKLARNLIDKLPLALKTRIQTIFSDAMASPAWRAKIEARVGRPLPQLTELAHPFDILKGEARTLADARMDVITFFICLLEALAHERHRFAFEKIQRMQATAATQAATSSAADRPQSC